MIDYILFHTPVWSFAVFNLADALITVGAVLVMVEELLVWRNARRGGRTFGRLTGDGRHRTVGRAYAKTTGRGPMPANFKAILITRDADKKQSVAIAELSEADLMDGDVTVSVEYTTVNYKDGLAITGKAPVVRRFPLVPGIDFAGTVIASSHPDFAIGDKVVLNGWGVGETHHGAFARRARVKGDWLVPLPGGLTAARRHGDRHRRLHGDAGGHGAGTARHRPRSRPGGRHRRCRRRRVGGDLAAVEARLPRRSPRPGGPQESDFLKELGAAEIISRDELSGPAKPLARERWAGGVDAVGSHTLANVLSMTSYGGAVAACGLAQAWTCPAAWRPSSCAASRCSASIR